MRCASASRSMLSRCRRHHDSSATGELPLSHLFPLNIRRDQAAQLIWLSSVRARKHRSSGPEVDDAPTNKPNHPMETDQDTRQSVCQVVPPWCLRSYHDGGSNGTDLGGNVQSRKIAGIGVIVTSKRKLSLAIDHKSNVGIYDRRLGSETLIHGTKVNFLIDADRLK